MRIAEIFAYKPPTKAFGQKKPEGGTTTTAATSKRTMSDQEAELFDMAKKYEKEDDWAQDMNPITPQNWDPPNLQARWRENDTNLRKIWRLWKQEGRI